jgi:hypothetical protein
VVNPWTGQPWFPATDTEWRTLESKNPEYAKALKEFQRDPFTFQKKMEADKAAHIRRASIKYTAEDHAKNPWVTGNKTEQGALKESDPILAERYKLEAGGVQLPFASNKTLLGALTDKLPVEFDLSKQAIEANKEWKQAIRQRRDEEAASRARRAQLGDLDAPPGYIPPRPRKPMRGLKPFGREEQEKKQKVAAEEHERLRVAALDKLQATH